MWFKKKKEEVLQCPKCFKDYTNYQHKCEVNFEVEDEPKGDNQSKVQWKDITVCHWCYNELESKNEQNNRK